MSFGEAGWEALRLAYQLGGFTADQHAAFAGTKLKRSYQVLGALVAQKLLDRVPVPTAGRPKWFYYLAKYDAGRAIQMGAHRAGVTRAKKVVGGYKLFQLPGAVEHHRLRNDFYLALRAASLLDGSGADFPREEMWGESWPENPLWGEGRPRAGERENARIVFERVITDGYFVGEWPGVLQGFVLEFENGSRPGDVMEKVGRFAGRWARLQGGAEREEPGFPPLAFDGFWPVVFVFPKRRTAENVLRKVREGVVSGMRSPATVDGAPAGGLARYAKLALEQARRGKSPGWFVLFTSLEAVCAAGCDPGERAPAALGRVYAPLEDRGAGSAVSLRWVAEGVASLRQGRR